MKVTAHLYYLEDAKGLLNADVDFIAHSVRDQEVDDELIGLLKERNVCLTPTLTREMVSFVYEEVPEFFEDPFFLKEVDPEIVVQLKDSRAATARPRQQGGSSLQASTGRGLQERQDLGRQRSPRGLRH